MLVVSKLGIAVAVIVCGGKVLADMVRDNFLVAGAIRRTGEVQTVFVMSNGMRCGTRANEKHG